MSRRVIEHKPCEELLKTQGDISWRAMSLVERAEVLLDEWLHIGKVLSMEDNFANKLMQKTEKLVKEIRNGC